MLTPGDFGQNRVFEIQGSNRYILNNGFRYVSKITRFYEESNIFLNAYFPCPTKNSQNLN